MKFKSLLLATLLVMASCSDNDEMPIDNSQQTVTENTNKISWNYPVLSPVFNELEQNYIFEYDSQGRVSKKVGGKLELSGSTGFPYAYSKSVYTMVTYTGNTATMRNYSSDPSFNVQLKERRFEFDNQGRVIKLVIPEVNNSYMDKYLTYTYDASGKLIEILTQYPNAPYDPTDPQDYILTYLEKFIYNNSGNLEKATKTEKHNNVDAYITNEITFDNFDSTQNPFKNLGVFEDYFYFSLSKNNPQRRISKEYQPYSSEFFLNQSNWTNQYNTNGSLKLFY